MTVATMSTQQQSLAIPKPETAPTAPRPREGPELPAIQLSRAQCSAIELLARGEPVMKVAEAVGVDRGTIYRWRTSDPNFIAALNRWRGEMQAETRDRVLALSAGAADSVARSIADGDSRLGLRVLEKMGCLKPGPDNPVDPYAVFGVGLDDEAARGPVAEGFRTVSRAMTPEQCRRAPQLLALGVALDNQRAGRPTPANILEMAGALAGENQDSPGLVQCPTHTDLPAPQVGAGPQPRGLRQVDPPRAADAPPRPLRVKAYVVRRS